MRRPTAVTLGVAILIGVAGCAGATSAVQAPSGHRWKLGPTPPLVAVGVEGYDAGTGLPFGAVLPEGQTLQWMTITSPGDYTVISAGDRVTAWSQIDTGCELSVGRTGLAKPLDDDDREATDSLLATFLGLERDHVSSLAFDSIMRLDGGGDVAVRGLLTDHLSGFVEFTLARALQNPPLALLVSAYCPPGEDPLAAMAAFDVAALHLVVDDS